MDAKKPKNLGLKELFENSDKAEFLEKLADVLASEGHRVVVIYGTRNKVGNGLNVRVVQSGFQYVFEELGFMQEGFEILEGLQEAEDPEDDDE